MESPNVIWARDLDELHEVLRLIPRDGDDCVVCDNDEQLTCNCPEGESCRYIMPTSDCTQCPSAECRLDEPSPADGSDSELPAEKDDNGTNVGAIAGGVIGGLVVVAIVAYLAWRFLIKPKRAASSHYSAYIVEADASQGMEKDGASQLTRRSSTHTVHSIASTVLTRASNIIQIAYIPGVTNRANPSEPGVLVPPVPPIPMQHSGNRESTNDDPHFFVPGDLRDSTYSGISGYSDRTSYARTSYAPRSSIASTIYGKQAQVMTGMQTGMRAKPTMVSVKSMGPGSIGGNTPPVPSINIERFGGNTRPKSGASTFSVGSTFLNTATQARAHGAQVVKVGGGLKTIEIGNRSETSSVSNRSLEDTTPGLESLADSATLTLVNDLTPPPAARLDQGPFADPPSMPSTPRLAEPPKLGSVMEAEPGEEQRAIAELSGSEPVVRRGQSPFGDEHATK